MFRGRHEYREALYGVCTFVDNCDGQDPRKCTDMEMCDGVYYRVCSDENTYARQ